MRSGVGSAGGAPKLDLSEISHACEVPDPLQDALPQAHAVPGAAYSGLSDRCVRRSDGLWRQQQAAEGQVRRAFDDLEAWLIEAFESEALHADPEEAARDRVDDDLERR